MLNLNVAGSNLNVTGKINVTGPNLNVTGPNEC